MPDGFAVGGYSYRTEDFVQWKLPGSLQEISGLAATADGRLFAHADERAEVHQLDYLSGKRLKTFYLSAEPGARKPRPARGDFEGIAVADEDLYLVTSRGRLYRSRIGADETAVAFTTFDTGLEDVCEVEGLTYHTERHVLLIACKTVYEKALRRNVVVFQWALDGQMLLTDDTITIPLERVVASGEFNPSGIAVSPGNGNLLLVAARQRALLEATITGKVVHVSTLPMESYHRQTEGIAVFASGTLVLADEGGSKRGRLGVYRATR